MRVHGQPLIIRDCTLPKESCLTGLDIVRMDRRGRKLVVLGAFEMGAGDVRNREEEARLRKAFQITGVECVIAGLWAVPDTETATLMDAMFKPPDAGKSPAPHREAPFERITSLREQRCGR